MNLLLVYKLRHPLYQIIFLMDSTIGKWKNIALGTLGIYSIYCVGGLLQEYIMEEPYVNWETDEEENITFSNAFILTPSLISWGLGSYLNRNMKTKTYIPERNLISCALLVVVTTLAFTKAIYLTSYPIVMMFKSCNVLSIITVSVFFSRVLEKTQRLKKSELMTGGIVTIGLLFYYLGGTEEHKQKSMNLLGLFLLVISLICDGFLPDFQAQIKANYNPSSMQMFEQTNKWKSIISLAYSIITFELVEMLTFFYYHPMSLIHLIILGSLGAVGQMVIFWMIKLFRQHIVPFIVTTRKIVTTLLSILFFKHSVTFVQFIGILLTLGIVVYDFYREINHQEKLKAKIERKHTPDHNQILCLLEQEITLQNMSPTPQQRIERQPVEEPIQRKEWRQKYELFSLIQQIYPPADLIQTLELQRERAEAIDKEILGDNSEHNTSSESRD